MRRRFGQPPHLSPPLRTIARGSPKLRNLIGTSQIERASLSFDMQRAKLRRSPAPSCRLRPGAIWHAP